MQLQGNFNTEDSETEKVSVLTKGLSKSMTKVTENMVANNSKMHMMSNSALKRKEKIRLPKFKTKFEEVKAKTLIFYTCYKGDH